MPTRAPTSRPRRGLGDNNVNCVIELISTTTQLRTHLDAYEALERRANGRG